MPTISEAESRAFLHRPLFAVTLTLLAALGLCGIASAHELLHRSSEVGAVVLQFYLPDGDRPFFEPYEVFPPDSETPFQTGRVNAVGEVTFRPDRQGEWRVRVATEDGHGTVVRVDVSSEGDANWTERGGGRGERVLAGLGYLAGIFGLIALWRLRTGQRENA